MTNDTFEIVRSYVAAQIESQHRRHIKTTAHFANLCYVLGEMKSNIVNQQTIFVAIASTCTGMKIGVEAYNGLSKYEAQHTIDTLMSVDDMKNLKKYVTK